MALLKRIRLENFRRFEKLTIGCQGTNIFVGPNNAGKSTILDALRVCRDVHRHAYRRKPVFTDQGVHGVCPTYALFHTQLSIPIENVVRDYGDEPALIQLDFDNNQRLFVRLHPDKSVSAYFVSEKRLSGTTAEYRSRFPAEFVVVPTLSALEETEECVLDETASKNENTRLSSRNFRNIIWRKTDQDFSLFSDIIKTGWPNIEIERPTRHFSPGQGWYLTMMYREGRIPREVYWSGFGFQIWMQMAAQMLRGGPNSILVIDEPDIYLHPDLQKKLTLNAKHRFPQIFMATHSTEIINDAEPTDVIAIDPVKYRARRISREQDYKNIYSYLGSSENSEFTRIAKAKRILFFEGNEKNLIRKFARHLALDDIFDDPYTVYLKAGGFSQWRRVKEIDWALENIFSLTVRVGAIFDRDYKCDEEIEDFCQRISGERLLIRVLERKEIENYVLHPDALERCIALRLEERQVKLRPDQIRAIIFETAALFEDDCRADRVHSYASFQEKQKSNIDGKVHTKQALFEFGKNWKGDGKFRILPGKDYISALSARLQKEYRASITIHMIADGMKLTEIDGSLYRDLSSLRQFFLQ